MTTPEQSTIENPTITAADITAGALGIETVDYDRAATILVDNALFSNESATNIALRSATARYSIETYQRLVLPAMLKVLHDDTNDLGYAIGLAEQVSAMVVDHATTEAKVHQLARTMGVTG